ncbi:MAG: DUF6691 family protein [Hydrogenovibrio sp.]|nr:DUF6691 family protein [Hydrogenovibrio sp.]
MEILLAIILGGAFGVVLQRIGATNPTRIISMLKLTDLKLAKTILLSIGLASIVVFIVNAVAPGAVHFSVKAAYLGVLIGGMIFGIGFAIGGLCPGTSLAAAGEGRKDALFFVVGGLLGAWAFALVYEHIKTTDIYATTLGGKMTVAEGVVRKGVEYHSLIGFMSGTLTAILIGVLLIAAARYLPSSIRKED